MGTANQVQVLDESVCISHNTNTLEKGMNLIIFPRAIGKIVKQTGLFKKKRSMATGLGEEKLWIKAC